MQNTVKTQLRGYCQLCGREQAISKRGAMAHHGYTVENGYFQGPCSGHRFAPIQRSRAQADMIVASVRLQVADLRARIAGLKAGTVKPDTAWDYGHKAEIPFSEAPEYAQEYAIDSEIRDCERRASSGTGFADYMAALIEREHGQALRTVTVEPAAAPIQHGERRLFPSGKIGKALYQEGARVYWTFGDGKKYWHGSRAWRALPIAE